jgi:hypothetical protein
VPSFLWQRFELGSCSFKGCKHNHPVYSVVLIEVVGMLWVVASVGNVDDVIGHPSES